MTTMEIRRTNGTMAQVAFEYAAADTYEAPSLFTVKTREVEIRNASVMTESDVTVYAEALKHCAAVIGGRVEGEKDLIACIRLDEVSYAKLQKEMKAAYEQAEEMVAAAAAR